MSDMFEPTRIPLLDAHRELPSSEAIMERFKTLYARELGATEAEALTEDVPQEELPEVAASDAEQLSLVQETETEHDDDGRDVTAGDGEPIASAEDVSVASDDEDVTSADLSCDDHDASSASVEETEESDGIDSEAVGLDSHAPMEAAEPPEGDSHPQEPAPDDASVSSVETEESDGTDSEAIGAEDDSMEGDIAASEGDPERTDDTPTQPVKVRVGRKSRKRKRR